MSSSMRWRNKTSELEELNVELNSKHNQKKADAIKKIIGYMNVGKDVSSLFFPVTRCLEINSVEIKKLVYLYIIHYSRTRPTDAIMVIASFVKDAKNKSSAMIRALAVRTMGCLRVFELCQYLVDPLLLTLKDKDAYVRKNAVMCIPKVYELAPKLVEDHGFLPILTKILEKEKNGLVISNTIIALSEINSIRPDKIEIITKRNLKRILLALNEAGEWSQVNILDFLAENLPSDSGTAEKILDKVLPRLSHINPSVVLSAAKVIITYMKVIDSQDVVEGLCRKLTAPVATLLSGDPENSWIVLRSFQMVVQKYPTIFTDVKIFFTRYQEPSYVKKEKLKLIYNITNDQNYELVLGELNEYAYDMDPDFTTMAVRYIWKIALKVSKSLAKVMGILASIVGNVGESGSGDHFLNEIMEGYQHVIRHYPKAMDYLENIKQIVARESAIVRPTSKSSMLYLIGEFSEHIPNSNEIIEEFIQNIEAEELEVQLQILTCAVKMYIKDRATLQGTISSLLQKTSENSDNADLRDRAFIYWRLLTVNFEAAKAIILGEKPATKIHERHAIDDRLVEKLIPQIGYITSVLHADEEELGLDVIEFDENEAFGAKQKKENEEDVVDEAANQNEGDIDILAGDIIAEKKPEEKKPVEKPQEIAEEDLFDMDILGGGVTEKEKPAQKQDFGLMAPPTKGGLAPAPVKQTGAQNTPAHNEGELDLMEFDLMGDTNPQPVQNKPQTQDQGFLDLGTDLLGGTPQTQSTQNTMGGGIIQSNTSFRNPPLEIVLQQSQPGMSGKTGVGIMAAVQKNNNDFVLNLRLQNYTHMALNVNTVMVGNNSFGLSSNQSVSQTITSQQMGNLSVNLTKGMANSMGLLNLTTQVQIATNYENYGFSVPLYPYLFLDGNNVVNSTEFKVGWTQFGQSSITQPFVPQLLWNDSNLIQTFSQYGINHLSTQNPGGIKKMYFGARLLTGLIFLIEISVNPPHQQNGIEILVKSENQMVLQQFANSILKIIK